MPRKARIDAAGAVHHIIGRGINRQAIFSDKKDYLNFIERLGGLVVDTKTPCFAWALIANHFHLLLKTGDETISKLMKRLLTGYALTYNRRHGRSGHLFQNRYQSILCQEETYLLELVRYIHLNPVRAKVAKEPEGYVWSGHLSYLGKGGKGLIDEGFVLDQFGGSRSLARRRYRKFV